jgi:Synaptobrevin
MSEPGHNIKYVAVARISDKTVVADHMTAEHGELTKGLVDGKIARVLGSERVHQGGRLTILDKDVGNINYDADPACLYLGKIHCLMLHSEHQGSLDVCSLTSVAPCFLWDALRFAVITAKDFPQRNAFKLLEEVRIEFEKEYADEFNSSKAFGLNKKARPLLKNIASKYDGTAANTKLQAVALQVDEVKGTMQSNINAVLKNQENLDTLLESSSTMRTDASAFQKSAVKVKDRLWWQNVRLMIAIIVLLIVLVLIIVIPIVSKAPTVPLSAP